MTPRSRPAVLPAATVLTTVVAALGVVSAAPAGAAAPQGLTTSAQLVLDRTNTARAAAGCAPLTAAAPLTASAAAQSRRMASERRLSHSALDLRALAGQLAGEGVRVRRAAENVASGYDAASVVAAWLASPGHRANVLDCRMTRVGIAEVPGASGPYWTQVFTGS